MLWSDHIRIVPRQSKAVTSLLTSMKKWTEKLSNSCLLWFLMCWENEVIHTRSRNKWKSAVQNHHDHGADSQSQYWKAVSEYSLKSPSSPKQQESGTRQRRRQQRQALMWGRGRSWGWAEVCSAVTLPGMWSDVSGYVISNGTVRDLMQSSLCIRGVTSQKALACFSFFKCLFSWIDEILPSSAAMNSPEGSRQNNEQI